MFWKCGKFEFDTRLPVVMGVINATPDSFSDGGKNWEPETAVENALLLVEQGAQIIDVGGESTRPGSEPVDPEEEWRRIEPIVETLADPEMLAKLKPSAELEELAQQGVCVSVDTRHASVAKRALAAGAAIINDVSGFRDEDMVAAVKDSDCGLVVMHMRGTPQTMGEFCDYSDVVGEVRDWLGSQVSSLEGAGIARERICIDPGPGFAKTPEQTLDVMRNLHEFRHVGCPVMAAPSRKRYLSLLAPVISTDSSSSSPKSNPSHGSNPAPSNLTLEQKDELTARECLKASELGAGVLRVHNVEAVKAALGDLKPYAVLSLGANVALVQSEGATIEESLIAQLNLAIQELLFLPDTQLIDVSPFYSSKAAYKTDQADFVNCAVLIRTGIAPLELLDYLHAIENSLGRVREVENGPRTLDIDIVDYQTYVCKSDVLTLPHPLAVERDFVVKPVSDVLPRHVLADGTPIDAVTETARVGRAFKLEPKTHTKTAS